MPTLTDTSERGLESVLVAWLTGQPDGPAGGIAELPAAYDADYRPGHSDDFDADHALDTHQLFAFLAATQPDELAKVNAAAPGPSRTKFLDRLQGEITRRGVVDVLLRGVQHQAGRFALMYGTPTPGNIEAAERFAANRFTVTRQLHYSRSTAGRSLDLALFINGLPVITFELKNSLTNQTYTHAIRQYQTDRDPRELIFQPGRCAVHFALDDQQVWFCTELAGKASVFLPFNRGDDDGAGNPPNPGGIMTDYLWKQVLTRRSLTNILENYARADAPKGGKGRMTVLWPRYHQLDVVRRLLADAGERGTGHRYLIQHSAGSGKSNSIAWLAHQLIGVRPAGAPSDAPTGTGTVFDSVIIVTDRRVLDDQIEATVERAGHVRGIVGAADTSADLREHLRSGRRIVTTTLQKFPMVVDTIGTDLSDRRFAVIIDEAHSSQGGRAASQMNQALATGSNTTSQTAPLSAAAGSGTGPSAPLSVATGRGWGRGDEDDDAETIEDRINELIAGRRLLGNASYFAFTATPKNRTLELFGRPVPEPDGGVAHRPFHAYTMKQAIQEDFIMDVLASYTPVSSYYRLAKAVEDDPEYDSARAQARLRQYVERPPARRPAEGEDHGRPLPRPGRRPAEDRRPAPGRWSRPTGSTAPSTTTGRSAPT